MKTLSDLIKENESAKKFKYNATVQIEGHVFAENEGSAGEMIDKQIDTVEGMISYEIINIEQDSSEGYMNPDLSIETSNEAIGPDEVANERAETMMKYISDTINSTFIPLNVQQKGFILKKVIEHCQALDNDLF